MSSDCAVLGVDFGTSNSAAGVLNAGKPRLIEMAPGQTTLPTTFFFDFDSRATLIGTPANQALLDGLEGRFMRALKRVLGTSLMHEPRQILNERVTFVDIIARFLAEIKARSEAATGCRFDRAVSGRPVVFHGVGDPREAQAEADLRQCYHAAGFTEVAFLPEPEAAALAAGGLNQSGYGLVVDIGGGTSDFALFEARADGLNILTNHGVRIGGTDFDRAISIDRVMPLLGKGTALRDAIGPGSGPAPVAIFNDLATWEKIPFLYNVKTRRAAETMLQQALKPAQIGRLVSVLDNELGHDVAFAVEAGKIAANDASIDARIHLGEVEPGLSIDLPPDTMATCLAPFAAKLHKGAADTLTMANINAQEVSRVVYVGGSSLMSFVPSTMKTLFPKAEHVFENVFTAVADGLTRAAGTPRLHARLDWS